MLSQSAVRLGLEFYAGGQSFSSFIWTVDACGFFGWMAVQIALDLYPARPRSASKAAGMFKSGRLFVPLFNKDKSNSLFVI